MKEKLTVAEFEKFVEERKKNIDELIERGKIDWGICKPISPCAKCCNKDNWQKAVKMYKYVANELIKKGWPNNTESIVKKYFKNNNGDYCNLNYKQMCLIHNFAKPEICKEKICYNFSKYEKLMQSQINPNELLELYEKRKNTENEIGFNILIEVANDLRCGKLIFHKNSFVFTPIKIEKIV